MEMSCFFTPDTCDCTFYVTDKNVKIGQRNWDLENGQKERLQPLGFYQLQGPDPDVWPSTSRWRDEGGFKEKRGIPLQKVLKWKKIFRNPGYIIREEAKLVPDQRCDSRLTLAGHGF